MFSVRERTARPRVQRLFVLLSAVEVASTPPRHLAPGASPASRYIGCRGHNRAWEVVVPFSCWDARSHPTSTPQQNGPTVNRIQPRDYRVVEPSGAWLFRPSALLVICLIGKGPWEP